MEQDYNEAAKWFRKAAEQGDARAQNKLGVLYFKEAIKLLKKAASQGNEKAKEYLGKLGVEDL